MITSTKHISYNNMNQSYNQRRNSTILTHTASTSGRILGFSNSFCEGAPFGGSKYDKGTKKKKK